MWSWGTQKLHFFYISNDFESVIVSRTSLLNLHIKRLNLHIDNNKSHEIIMHSHKSMSADFLNFKMERIFCHLNIVKQLLKSYQEFLQMLALKRVFPFNLTTEYAIEIIWMAPMSSIFPPLIQFYLFHKLHNEQWMKLHDERSSWRHFFLFCNVSCYFSPHNWQTIKEP